MSEDSGSVTLHGEDWAALKMIADRTGATPDQAVVALIVQAYHRLFTKRAPELRVVKWTEDT